MIADGSPLNPTATEPEYINLQNQIVLLRQFRLCYSIDWEVTREAVWWASCRIRGRWIGTEKWFSVAIRLNATRHLDALRFEGNDMIVSRKSANRKPFLAESR